ncbi:hypothetical protein [Candidatus Ichthyocystis hellenicum]|nr:hypothetical protein [Candidatus Ichthyocystis hellenicum]
MFRMSMNLPMFLATLDIADPDNFALFDRSDIIFDIIIYSRSSNFFDC